ncbi:hypothetical protein MRX96_031911 [Rhipicephalus microplus]
MEDIADRYHSVGEHMVSEDEEEEEVEQPTITTTTTTTTKKKVWWKKQGGGNDNGRVKKSGLRIPEELFNSFKQIFSMFNSTQQRRLKRLLLSLDNEIPIRRTDTHVKFFTNATPERSFYFSKYIPKGSDEQILSSFDSPDKNVVFAHTLMVLSLTEDRLLTLPERAAALWIRMYCNMRGLDKNVCTLILQDFFSELFEANTKKLEEYFTRYKKRDSKLKDMPNVSPSDAEEEEECTTNKHKGNVIEKIKINKADLMNVSPNVARWRGVFDRNNKKSPVTVSERTTSKLDKVKVSYCVNHRLTNCYIYNMNNKYETLYAITCTLLNTMFMSKTWQRWLLWALPEALREPFVSMYRKCCATSVSYKAYLDMVHAWVQPGLRYSYDELQKHKTDKVGKKKTSAYEIINEEQTNTVLSNCTRQRITRVFAQLLLGKTVSASDKLVATAINDKYDRVLKIFEENDLDSYKSVLELIAAGKIQDVGIHMLLNSYIDWEADTLPLLTSPEARVYDAPDMSESCYLDFKENFPFQQSCIDNYTVLNPRYFSPCFPEDVQENGCEVLYGYGVFTFWVTVMAYYMCAKALSRANNATENDNDDAPATPRRSTGVASALARAAASSAHTKKRGQVEDDGGEGAMDKYGNAWTMDNTNEVHGMHVKEDSRPMVFIFWAKPKDKAFLLTLAKAVNVIIRLHRGSDDMQKNKSPYAKNIYTYITLDRAPDEGVF